MRFLGWCETLALCLLAPWHWGLAWARLGLAAWDSLSRAVLTLCVFIPVADSPLPWPPILVIAFLHRPVFFST